MNGYQHSGGNGGGTAAATPTQGEALQQKLADSLADYPNKVYGGGLGRNPSRAAVAAGDISPLQRLHADAQVGQQRLVNIYARLHGLTSKMGGGVPENGRGGEKSPTLCGGVVGEIIAINDQSRQILDGIDDLLGYLGKLVD